MTRNLAFKIKNICEAHLFMLDRMYLLYKIAN